MLFVSDYCGKMIQEKYQFFEVYPTVDHRWAFPGDPYFYDQQVKDKVVKPVQVAFKDDVSFDINEHYNGNRRPVFAEPYYQVDGLRMKPLVGTYPEDLLKIKKDGVLKARGIKLEE
jgi:hypothetical protein